MDYGKAKITWHALECQSLHNVDVGHYLAEEEETSGGDILHHDVVM